MSLWTYILSHSHAPNIVLSLPDDRDLHCSDCEWRNVLFCHLIVEFFLFRVSTQALIPLMAKIHLSGSSPKNFRTSKRIDRGNTVPSRRHLPADSKENLKFPVTQHTMCTTEAEKPRLVVALVSRPHLDDL
ncbi:hypothetical protein Tco_0462456 [Tanacetum coccineum]